MNDYVIIADIASDLNAAMRKKFGVADVLPGHITFPDGHEETADLEWGNISSEAFYASMRDRKNVYKTSLPSLGEIMDTFEKYLVQGLDVLSISLSGGMSGTYSATIVAAKKLAEKYPDRRVVCFDSLRYSTALSAMCVFAARMRAQGKSLEEVHASLLKNKYCFHQMGSLDDLFFLQRQGRVSGTAAVMGTLVGIKSMADFNREGRCTVLAKPLGFKAVYKGTIGYMKRTIVDPEHQTVFVAHSNREKEARRLAALIEETFHPEEVVVTTVGQSCGVNIGPGLMAAFYHGTEISEDLANETAMLAEALAE